MSSEGGIEPFDWFRRFFGSGTKGQLGFGDMFRGFDEIGRQMERQFEEQFRNFESLAPKEFVKEYQTPDGVKAREFGPFVYGYSMSIGPDGKPRVREFGNVKSPLGIFGSIKGRDSRTFFTKPLISSEIEPLADLRTTDKEVKIVVEMPGVSKENIKISVYDNSVEVTTITDSEERKYRKIIDIPPETDIETAKSSYKNGILEITFKKKEQTKPKGKQINID